MKSIFTKSLKQIKGIHVLIISMFLLFACEGPQGDIGPRGYDGATGQDGQDGQDGIDGINYTYSAIYSLLPIDWSGDINRYTTTLDVPEITEDIYNIGAVLVYELIEEAPKSFNMLPFTYIDNNYTYMEDYDVYIGSIDLFVKEIIDGTNTTARPDVEKLFKVVIIEGLSLDGLKSKVDVSNFEEVNRFLNTLPSIK
jgi:hypothetical protein